MVMVMIMVGLEEEDVEQNLSEAAVILDAVVDAM